MVLFFYIKNILKSDLTTAEWILFTADSLLTLGALIMAVIVTRLGYSKLVESSGLTKRSQKQQPHAPSDSIFGLFIFCEFALNLINVAKNQ